MHQKTLLNFIQRSNDLSGSIEKINQGPMDEVELSSDDILTADGPNIDLEAAKTWVYPVNVPMRDYQYSIVQTALFSNTLVSLPTGLGKTLIAAVVMYNFFRWFPAGKIVFTAPSRPLVLQQIEACHESVGIPQEYTIDMTGQMNPGQRSKVWQDKRVFFVTPQVFEKDIQSGSCPMKELVCLVVDEAHRAMGNYAYCVVIRKLMDSSIRLRILALTATPGSKQITIQSVVDNLRISRLEYRNEDDPDVKQYVHNRKLELVQVPMDSESLKIRDLFLEIVQPLVNRLCGFGVFYSKDAARLAPYEFLVARDKFRQAPPAAVDPRQFGEVEACFGAAITLYHIFKLLFSHGIRPAFEMLKEKLQSGLMGHNEKLQEIKIVMQKHVNNGASSPKLRKLLELMADHFEANDPCKTRVIIFTNFRESVKDILEALKVLGDTVKAMDFIGQSSGRGSKGQSQKVQQLVLQKFRMGGFNTIVATSIAEEGLDIMEVDLVICFDANISPLRMIQRMGRTGRKRDGRVIVLASEGAEHQGYLKKQAKTKVLGKHMHHGGIHCFNFHSSPRMVPHSIRPEPQLVELSIAKFVPRMKRKQKAGQVSHPGAGDLTAKESEMIERYIMRGQDLKGNWEPSLIAFPHCQLYPTQVYNVRHSEWTTSMLIDTLQSLSDWKCERRGDDEFDGISGEKSSECDDTSTPNCLQQNGLKISSLKGDSLDEVNDTNPATTVLFPCSPESSKERDVCNGDEYEYADLSGKFACLSAEPSYDGPLDVGPRSCTPDISVNVEAGVDIFIEPSPREEICILGNEQLLTEAVDLRIAKVSISSEKHSNTLQAAPLANLNEVPSRLYKTGSLYCASEIDMNSQLLISVDGSGYVHVCSPPMLPLNSSFLRQVDRQLDKTFPKFLGMPANQSNSKVLNELGNLTTDQVIDHNFRVKCTNEASCDLQSPFTKGPYFVASTPEEKMSRGDHDRETGKDCELLCNDDSPRLCTLAAQGVVPSSPDLSGLGKQADEWEGGSRHIRNTLMVSCEEYLSRSGKESSLVAAVADGTKGVGGYNSMLSVQTIDDIDLAQMISSIKVSNENNETEKVSTSLQTPVQDSSNSSFWRHTTEMSCSLQKPQKFRRLRKAKEAREEAPREIQRSDHQVRGSSEKQYATGRMMRCPRKQKLSFAAALLVDQEAEVSSDEDVSADEDESEEQGSLQDFIDDESDPAIGTSEGTNEPIDMMAVYRKSLLTQSPLDGSTLPWIRRALQANTPISDSSNILGSDFSKSVFSESPETRITAGNASAANDPVDVHKNNVVTPNDAERMRKSKMQGSEQFGTDQRLRQTDYLPDNMHSTTKVHERKRKLSFQQEQTLASWNVANLSEHLDDELFAGLDLDALEVEAVQKSRLYQQANSITQDGVAPSKVVHVESAKNDDNDDACNKYDEDLEFFPSFNLGID
ncbi:hypothetical protein KP509_36G062700 [Ceratopteris richardii]|uniref:Fanconi anemia group M protein n=2 Tax=Ceratopteris richardii TaxID=49495 RepID=A0A8T2QEA9_CERRI|nr:hypothetical protein KP509_36G062700 [Ceratopteris richardii]KAH7281774.1 hypothetical protein KP509_36G062700 [Ceratopteris richardii]